MISVAWASPPRPKYDFGKMDNSHWVTAAGERIRVSKMSLDHVVNTVLMLRRNVDRTRLQDTLRYLAVSSMFDTTPEYDSQCNGELAAGMWGDDEDYLARTFPPYARMLKRIKEDLGIDTTPGKLKPLHNYRSLDESLDYPGGWTGDDENTHGDHGDGDMSWRR